MDGDILGNILIGYQYYEIKSIGDFKYVLRKYDQGKYPSDCSHSNHDDKPKVVNPNLPKLDAPPTLPINNTQLSYNTKMAPTISQGCNLRIMIHYTPAVSSVVNNPINLCQQSIDLLNQTFINSGINHTAELAYAGQVNYTETGNNDIDKNDYGNPNDGIIDHIHGMRNDYSADLCAIFTTSSTYAGIAAEIYADQNHAFCQVTYNYAVNNITFPHEIGHLLGARHNMNADPTSTPFQYGHGFWVVSATSHFLPFLHYWGFRSVMCYDPATWMNTVWSSYNVPRIPVWSNPNYIINSSQFGALSFGTSTNENNKNVLALTIPDARTFRLATQNLIVSSQIFNNNIGSHIAENISTSGTVTVPSSSTISFQAGQSVTLSNGFQATAGSNFLARIVPISLCSGNPNAGGSINGGTSYSIWDELALSSNYLLNAYPNPTNGVVNIEFEVKSTIPIIILCDINGKTIRTFENSNFKIGMNKLEYDFSNLNSGTYFVKLQYGKDIFTLKTIYSQLK